MPLDIALDGDFDVYLDDRNDLATVSDRKQFEQSVAVYVTDLLYSHLGTLDAENKKRRLRMEVRRVARIHDFLDNVESIEVTEHPDLPNAYLIDVKYVTDDPGFQTEVSA